MDRVDLNLGVKVYTDIHRYAPHEIQVEFTFEKKTIYIGDIFDLVNCKEEDINKARTEQNTFTDMCNEYNVPNVVGNHDLIKSNNFYYKMDNYLFCHGHTIDWHEQKVYQWQLRSPEGCGKLKWYALKLKHMFDRKWEPNQYQKMRAKLALEKFKCDTLIMGHVHNDKVRSYQIDKDYKIIALPRGIVHL